MQIEQLSLYISFYFTFDVLFAVQTFEAVIIFPFN